MFDVIQNLIRKNIILYYFFRKIVNSPIFLNFYRPELQILGKLKEKIVFLDVGSNDGIFVNLIISKFKEKINKLYIIEPINYLNKNLKTKYKKFDNIKIFKCLVSNKKSYQKIAIPYFKFLNFEFQLSGYSSNKISSVKFDLKQYFNESLINKKIFFKHELIKTELVDSLKIKPDFIKIIMAGCQYEILKGSEKTIKENKPIIYLNQRSDKVENYLSKFGYEKYIYNIKLQKLKKLKKFSTNHHIVFFICKNSKKKLII